MFARILKNLRCKNCKHLLSCCINVTKGTTAESWCGGWELGSEEATDMKYDLKYRVKVVFKYEELCASIGKLVQEKQEAYGDSFGKAGKVLAILYPEGIPLAKLDDALTVVRVVDKLFRIATDKDALGESPWRDICGYALLSVAREEKPLLGTRNSNGEKVERDIAESMKEGK